jgi:hypothetical protein
MTLAVARNYFRRLHSCDTSAIFYGQEREMGFVIIFCNWNEHGAKITKKANIFFYKKSLLFLKQSFFKLVIDKGYRFFTVIIYFLYNNQPKHFP